MSANTAIALLRAAMRAKSPRTVSGLTWGIVGVSTISFAYTYGAQQTMTNRSAAPDDRKAASERYLWAQDNLMFSRKNVHEGRWWTAVTSTFSHGNLGHIMMNMTSLYSFAPALIRGMGAGYFMILYLGGGVASSAFSDAFGRAEDYDRPALGASGALCALMSCNATVNPRSMYSFFGVFPMRAWPFIGTFTLVSVVLQSSGTLSGIGHLAHIGGVIAGPGIFFALKALWKRGLL